MENPRPEKVAVVTEVREKLTSSSAALLTEYRGLNVAALAELRRALANAGGEYKIYKNTLVRFAARDAGITELDALLTGPTAIAFVDGDAAAVAKALRDYVRTNPALVVKGGVLGSKVLDAASVNALADLPPREVVLAQLAGALAAPLRNFASLLQALPRNFAYGLQALIDRGGAAGAPASETAEAPAADAPAADADAPAADADAPAADAAEADTAEPTPDPTPATTSDTTEES